MEEDQQPDQWLTYSVHLILMEKLPVVLKMQDDFEILLKKHKGHFRQIIIYCLKKCGVDIQVYFSGVIDRTHCMKLAENGECIMSVITKEIRAEKLVEDNTLLKSLTMFEASMRNIIWLWFSSLYFMERVGCIWG